LRHGRVADRVGLRFGGLLTRFDYEYERNGTANLFMMFAPLEGWLDVGQVFQDASVIHGGMAICDLDLAGVPLSSGSARAFRQ
jgi:hypothetical protein